MTKVVNLYGGPGTGKSTTAAGVFHLLKLAGVNAELVPEYAKDLVWGDITATLKNQIYIFGKQHNRIFRLLNKVDVVVTDSPILLSLAYYKGDNPHFPEMVYMEYRKMHNIDVFLRRVKEFNPAGRLQDEEKAKDLDLNIRWILNHRVGQNKYHEFDADKEAARRITGLVLQEL